MLSLKESSQDTAAGYLCLSFWLQWVTWPQLVGREDGEFSLF